MTSAVGEKKHLGNASFGGREIPIAYRDAAKSGSGRTGGSRGAQGIFR